MYYCNNVIVHSLSSYKKYHTVPAPSYNSYLFGIKCKTDRVDLDRGVCLNLNNSILRAYIVRSRGILAFQTKTSVLSLIFSTDGRRHRVSYDLRNNNNGKRVSPEVCTNASAKKKKKLPSKCIRNCVLKFGT